MKYFIYAYPEMYGGLHGMYNYEFTDDISYDAACEWGYELAIETVDQFLYEDQIYSHEDYMADNHNGEEWNDKYEEDYWEAFNEAREEQCAYEVYELKDGYDESTYQNWQKENLEPRDFIRRFCKTII